VLERRACDAAGGRTRVLARDFRGTSRRSDLRLVTLAATLLLLPLPIAASYVAMHEFQLPVMGVQALAADGTGDYFGVIGGGYEQYGAIFAVHADGSGFRILHTSTSTDGRIEPTLALDGFGHVYGTTNGPDTGVGRIFRMKRDGTEYSVIFEFPRSPTFPAPPDARIISDGSHTLYGTTSVVDTTAGTVFRIQTDGTGFEVLHQFSGSTTDGYGPMAALLIGPSHTLFGTTWGGGAGGLGVVFRIEPDGSGFRILHSFAGAPSDGAGAAAALTTDGLGHLFGTTSLGGASDLGTLFSLGEDGSGFSVWHSFPGTSGDGFLPGPLVMGAHGELFGAASSGGNGDGLIFSLTTSGNGYSIAHAFDQDSGSFPQVLVPDEAGGIVGGTSSSPLGGGTVFWLASDGGEFRTVVDVPGFAPGGFRPLGPLIADAEGNLFGTADRGGDRIHRGGTLFTIRVDGSEYQTLHQFGPLVDGSVVDGLEPNGYLTLGPDGDLYGATKAGGEKIIPPYSESGGGVLYRMRRNGDAYEVLVTFYSEVGLPEGKVAVEDDGTVIGEAKGFGSLPDTVWLWKDGMPNVTSIHAFQGGASDGSQAQGGLVRDSSGRLYGVTSGGGGFDNGTIFAIDPDGAFTILHSFAEGLQPVGAPLVLGADDVLYGMAGSGGVYAVRTDGTDFRLLRQIQESDGAGSGFVSQLALDDFGDLYGTSGDYPSSLFMIRPEGGCLSVLQSFPPLPDQFLVTTVTVAGGSIVGTISDGGSGGGGFLYRYTGSVSRRPCSITPAPAPRHPPKVQPRE